MNGDVKELLETGAVILLVLVFAVCMLLVIKWGASYQVMIVFAGFVGTLLGVLGNKLRAGGPANTSAQPTDTTSPKAQ